ncbi:phosphate/phosphite/phosphonate ABC transporter substrate-binding protein [Candidatus Methylocalor cossyra]|uniref:ABC-type phosphate/phosphonate transport system periplasmic component n=1 Tax=Candidatus Methylocalor cossyra TaxID=3108543 RepID=A0ABP1C4V4_9GAMM
MIYNFTVSPDFGPEKLPGWYIFNTWLQKALGETVHLEVYPDFKSQREAIKAGKVDLIYANPYDASMLVREKGFISLAKPKSKSDEAIIAVNAARGVCSVEELRPGITVAATDDPDVRTMGMILLEPADLHPGNITLELCDSYVLVAKRLFNGEAEVGIFLAEAFDELSSVVKSRLRVLVQSEIQVVHHSLMLGPALAFQRDRLRNALLEMSSSTKGCEILRGLGFDQWEPVDQEAVEFMIDLMDTLLV